MALMALEQENLFYYLDLNATDEKCEKSST